VEQQQVAHEEIISQALKAMHRSVAQDFTYELLQAGVSGSYTYHIKTTEDDFALKAVLPDCASYVMQRARREALFYRHLAHKITLRVPHVLDTYLVDETAGAPIYVLMAPYRPSKPPREWREGEYIDAAEQLGRFHAIFWSRTRELRDLPWLKRDRRVLGPGFERVIQQAHQYWHDLRQSERGGTVLSTSRYSMLLEIMQHVQNAAEFIRSFPLTLCHGDCHMGNVLRDRDGEMVWADWQEVGLGRGPSDLSFFLERAYFAGAQVPHEQVIQAYIEALETNTGQRVPEFRIRRVMAGVELLSWLLAWPPYLGMGSDEQLTQVLERIDFLADSLEISG
jgi:Ser/Thr protein kinase RdoA (MazF antagonist)